MKTLYKSLTGNLSANHIGLAVFGCLTLATAVVLATNRPGVPRTPLSNDQVKIVSRLSQSKLVRGDVNTVYLDIDIRPPVVAKQAAKKASDVIVVLDRSGSMSADNKMPYAKTAIVELLSRLNENDRFALVSFADKAIVHSPLSAIDGDRRGELQAMVNAIRPGGGTNMGEGLLNAVRLLAETTDNRATKVLLLSDGQANQGITDSGGLSRIVGQLTEKRSVLSSIGMGLDFNETLMSVLADYGMGHYDYLENLAGLGEIFTRSLESTRNIFAASSHLTLTLNDNVELIDAAGYPVSRNGQTLEIRTGELLGNATKNFILTFQVKPQYSGNLELGELQLSYDVEGNNRQKPFSPEQLTFAVVEPAHREEARASIDRGLYQQSWLKNNFGLMQKKLSHWVREGNKDKAEQLIADYRKELAKAEQEAAVPLASDELDDKLNKITSGIANAFSGSVADQEVKRKRAAKNMQFNGIKEQRIVQQ